MREEEQMRRKGLRGTRGFTLTEVMITVAIIGILTAIAYPAYTTHIRKGKRAECRSALFQAMQQQERYFTQYSGYYTAMAESPANSLVKNFSGDSPTKSACYLSALPATAGCTAPGCLILQARRTDADPVSAITLDTMGNKGCTYNGTTYTSVTGTAAQRECWP